MSRLQTLLSTLPKLVIPQAKPAFTCFSNLPPELRFRMWKEAANNEPRNIYIQLYSSVDWGTSYPTELKVRDVMRACPPVQGFLLACKETRKEALPFYAAYKEKAISRHKRLVHINFAIDRFILPHHCIHGVRFPLAFDTFFSAQAPFQNFHKSILTHMQRLIRTAVYDSRGRVFGGPTPIDESLWTQATALQQIFLVAELSGYQITSRSTLTTRVLDIEGVFTEELDRTEAEVDRLKQFRDSAKRVLGGTVDENRSAAKEVGIEWIKYNQLDLGIVERQG